MKSLLAALLFAELLLAQKPAEQLKPYVEAISTSDVMKYGQWGFCLMDAETGNVLSEHHSDTSLIPASVMKLATSGAALGILGENYRFETRLESSGDISDGVLRGDLFIRGGGDPTLGSDRFQGGESSVDAWAQKIREMGITKIDGRVVADASIFEDAMLSDTWIWSDIGNYYGAGACGLSFHENLYQIYFKPNQDVEKKAELVRVEPNLLEIEFVNEMRTGAPGSGDQGYIYGAPYTSLRHLRGSIPQGPSEFGIKGSIPDPAEYTARRLREALLNQSIEVTGAATTVRHLQGGDTACSEDRKVLYTHTSPPLKDILFWQNKASINLYAEHLLKILGAVRFHEGSEKAGVRAVCEFWRASGVDLGGFFMEDGSGLSHYNTLTAGQLTTMLRQTANSQAFYNSLPIAGDPQDAGSLKKLCLGTRAAQNLRAKSGSMSRVMSYAGYVHTTSGKPLCFVMIANNYTCKRSEIRALFENLMVAMAELP